MKPDIWLWVLETLDACMWWTKLRGQWSHRPGSWDLHDA